MWGVYVKPLGRSMIAVQCAFRRHFDILLRVRVPDQKCILMQMNAFRATENVLKERKEPSKTIRTPENVKRVLVPIQTGR
ncbi:hypothetical protein TNCV_33441 [Trichonephila clavipes]|nr:hypothetical protein TNCV_33441 [Trichonephila clavipes]